MDLAPSPKYRKIAPKPPGYDEEHATAGEISIKVPMFERMKITRRYMYKIFSKDIEKDNLPEHVTKREIGLKKDECVKHMKEKEKFEPPLNSSDGSYFWKCVMLSIANWRILENIAPRFKITVWKVRCLLEGLQSEKMICIALKKWSEFKKEPQTRILTEINKQIKSETYGGDVGATQTLVLELQAKDKEIGQLQTELDAEKQKMKILTNDFQKKVDEVRILSQRLNELRPRTKSLEDTVSTLYEENRLLRFARKMQDDRLKLLGVNSATSGNKDSSDTVEPEYSESNQNAEDINMETEKDRDKKQEVIVNEHENNNNNNNNEKVKEKEKDSEKNFENEKETNKEKDEDVDKGTGNDEDIDKGTGKEKENENDKDKEKYKEVDITSKEEDKTLRVGQWVCIGGTGEFAIFGKVVAIHSSIISLNLLRNCEDGQYKLIKKLEHFETNQIIDAPFEVKYLSQGNWRLCYDENALNEAVNKWSKT